METLSHTLRRVGLAVGALFVGLLVFASPDTTHSQPTDDPAALRDLAERFLTYTSSFGTSTITSFSGGLPGTRLLVGQLPADLPVVLPLTPDSRLLGSAVRTEFGFTYGSMVLMEVDEDRTHIASRFESAFHEQGWSASESVFNRFSFSETGFQASVPIPTPAERDRNVYCGPGGARDLEVRLFPRLGRRTTVLIGFGYPSPLGSQSLRCGFPPQRLEDPLLPMLEGPEGVLVFPGGSSGGTGSATSEAYARTDMSIEALEAHFADQLEAAGWVRVNSHAASLVAWSAWKLPREGECEGLLLVWALPEGSARQLQLRAVCPISTGPSWDELAARPLIDASSS